MCVKDGGGEGRGVGSGIFSVLGRLNDCRDLNFWQTQGDITKTPRILITLFICVKCVKLITSASLKDRMKDLNVSNKGRLPLIKHVSVQFFIFTTPTWKVVDQEFTKSKSTIDSPNLQAWSGPNWMKKVWYFIKLNFLQSLIRCFGFHYLYH